MANAVLRIDINQGQQIPNSTQSQAGFKGQAEEASEATQVSDGLNLKKTAVAFGFGKIAINTLQTTLYYQGNKVLQNQYNRGIDASKKLLAVGAIALVSGIGAGAFAVNEFIDVAYSNAQREIDIKRQNLDSYEQRDLYNTNLNNNRYIGGRR